MSLKKPHLVGVYITSDEKKFLDSCAKKTSLSRSDFLRYLISGIQFDKLKPLSKTITEVIK